MDETGELFEQNVSLKLDRLHFGLLYKRLSKGSFRWWPAQSDQKVKLLAAHELQLLLWNGNPSTSPAGEMWKKIEVQANFKGHT